MKIVKAGTRTEKRKDEHIGMFESGGPRFKAKSTLLEEVQLVPRAMPSGSLEEVVLELDFLGKHFEAPVLISSMTGGSEHAARINLDIAEVAEELGLGMGLGSQRAMIENPDRAKDYKVRRVAPSIFIGGNIGVAQVVKLEPDRIADAVAEVEADALFVHLNPAMEAVQIEGDTDFKRALESLAALVQALDVPVIVKEVGSGIDPHTAKVVAEIGVEVVDVAGAGGTSWVGVEVLRGKSRQGGVGRSVGEAFWDWGIPTAACLLMLSGLDLDLIASGGVYTGLDMAKCLALGARLCGIAGPVMEAYLAGGRARVKDLLQGIVSELKLAVFLTGCTSAQDLAGCSTVIGPSLAAWRKGGM